MHARAGSSGGQRRAEAKPSLAKSSSRPALASSCPAHVAMAAARAEASVRPAAALAALAAATAGRISLVTCARVSSCKFVACEVILLTAGVRTRCSMQLSIASERGDSTFEGTPSSALGS